MHNRYPALVASLAFLLAFFVAAQEIELLERFRARSVEAEQKGLAEPYRGIVIGGAPETGLFPLRSTGVSTEPVQKAAEAFLSALTPEQRARTLYPVDDPEWRKWMNQHFYVRQGVVFREMSEVQRERALDLMRASLSARGMQLSRDIMRLNHTLGELDGDNFVEFGEWLYSITVMGEPSPVEPWGWQIDGHHLIINYFVLGDQVVMSPAFFGSEPVAAEAGKFEGVEILQAEQDQGLAFMRSLAEAQQARATLAIEKEGNNNLGEAWRDNLDLEFAGIQATDLDRAQKSALLELIALYVSNMDEGHAAIRMDEVEAHLDDTWFAWIGGTSDDAVYYYRILSPVIMIEFDHQRPANLRHLYPPVPNRQHIHTVVRTPNGNDYGKDLLRQHLKTHPH